MNVRDIVKKAWQITQVHLKKLIWYGSVPAFFSVIVSSVYLAYQYNAFRTSEYFGGGNNMNMGSEIRLIWDLVINHPGFTVFVVITAILIFCGYILTPPIFRGTLIHALKQIKDFKSVSGSFEKGVRKFFPMFEFAIITGSFSITTVFTESSFVLRWWGENVFFFALPILLFIGMVGLIASLMFTYSEYFIVLKDMALIESIKESAILVISNLRKTILVLILMLLISARIILNVILVLFIPMGVIVATTYFAAIFFNIVGFILIGIFGLGILLVASYLMGLFNVFSTAVWVLTFSILTENPYEEIKDEDLS